MDALRLNNVTKSYQLGEIPLQVLKGISMVVQQGELAALMGASGSGKSTLLNILGCLDRPTSGQYQLNGKEVSKMSPDQRALMRGHSIGFVFQSFNLLPRTSALDQVLMPLSYTDMGLSNEEAKERAVSLLQQMGLADRLDHEPSQLSGGQQQRVAIARALVNKPPLLLADEPTGNLDSKTSQEILEMFRQLNQEQKITILLVTHDPSVAAFTGRTIRIKDGLIESGAFPAGAAESTQAMAQEVPSA